MDENILVTVTMCVYNHEQYLKKAIEGVVRQKINFRMKLLIGEDCSTDKSRTIIDNLKAQYPELIETVYYDKNVGANENTKTLFGKIKSKYVALCDGDDYWIDENKLQRQVSILENNPTFSSCFHSVSVQNDVPGITFKYPHPGKNILTFKDIFSDHYIPTCSFLFRWSFLPFPLPDWFDNAKVGDIPMELILADKGNVFFIDEELACYRRHGSSLTSTPQQKRDGKRIYLYVYKNLNRHFNYEYRFLFGRKILFLYLGMVKDYVKKFIGKT